MGSSEDRLVVFQSEHGTTLRAAGATPRPVLSSPMRRRAGETNITCMQLMHASHKRKRKAYHEICNGILLRVTRAPVASPDASPHRSASRVPILVAAPPRLSCPTLLRPVLSRIGDSELGLTRPALGADYNLTSLTSVKHREDDLLLKIAHTLR